MAGGDFDIGHSDDSQVVHFFTDFLLFLKVVDGGLVVAISEMGFAEGFAEKVVLGLVVDFFEERDALFENGDGVFEITHVGECIAVDADVFELFVRIGVEVLGRHLIGTSIEGHRAFAIEVRGADHAEFFVTLHFLEGIFAEEFLEQRNGILLLGGGDVFFASSEVDFRKLHGSLEKPV